MRASSVIGILVACSAAVAAAADRSVALSELDLSQASQSYGRPAVDKSIAGNAIEIGGQSFANGVGTNVDFRQQFLVNGAKSFSAMIGIDDDAGPMGHARFKVYGDGKLLLDSGMMNVGDAARPIDVPLTGVKRAMLVAVSGPKGINFGHADWAEAHFTVDGDSPTSEPIPAESTEVQTPPAPPTPRINGASVFGVRPGSPILFTLAVTGDRPMQLTATGLPDGATFDAATGRFGGAVSTAGTYVVHVTAHNGVGSAEGDLKLVVGDKLALTPMMGWNSWYGFANRVSDQKMRYAADQLVATGLVNHGYSYVCIDDFWQQAPRFMKKDPTLGGVGRDADGHIVPNPRFPDMHALTDYIHARGLKAGVYSSPGPFTCGGALGSFDHEADDARTYADWGFDLLKYDWCSYNPKLEAKRTTPLDPTKLSDWGAPSQEGHAKYVLPYAQMGDLIRQQKRDIFYLMCQYGMGQSWNWADTVDGNSARTTGDITDTWATMTSIGFGQFGKQGVFGPGCWSDPDMLMIGVIGLDNPHPTKLTPNEQYTQVTLWSILPAPLLFGAHLDKLDPFTMGLLTNDEVIAVDQDPLGKQGRRVSNDGESEVWSKDLADGSVAVAMFNRSEMATDVTAQWSAVGLSGDCTVRDIWRQRDLRVKGDSYTASVPRHGAVFIRCTRK